MSDYCIILKKKDNRYEDWDLSGYFMLYDLSLNLNLSLNTKLFSLRR